MTRITSVVRRPRVGVCRGARYAARGVVVDVSRIIKSDQDPAGWTAASVHLE